MQNVQQPGFPRGHLTNQPVASLSSAETFVRHDLKHPVYDPKVPYSLLPSTRTSLDNTEALYSRTYGRTWKHEHCWTYISVRNGPRGMG